MHHEVLGQCLVVIVLQQEAHLPEMEVGHPVAVGGQGEPEILIELPGEAEVAGRHECLDFGHGEIGHGFLVRLTGQTWLRQYGPEDRAQARSGAASPFVSPSFPSDG
ncbi:hypothetical protein D3C72_1584010 [compost metagenome]